MTRECRSLRREDICDRKAAIAMAPQAACSLLYVVFLVVAFPGCTPPAVERADAVELPRELLTMPTPIATFDDATALDTAPDGTIYVTDRGADAVIVLREIDRIVYGGPGTQSGQFDEPADIDAGNGLVIHVADAGNRRVQRFSREFRYLGSVPVSRAAFGTGALDPQNPGSSGDDTRNTNGRPISVATSSTDDLFVVDEVEGVVLKWDLSLRPERVIGAFGSGDGALVQPVAVATDGSRRIYVADASLRSIVVYDVMGTFIRQVHIPGDDPPRSVAATETGMLVVTRNRIYVFDETGLSRVLEPSIAEPLVDVEAQGRSILVLTEKALFRTGAVL